MKILMIHNFYQQPGGEDAVFQAEYELLASQGHALETLCFDNRQIRTRLDVLLTGLSSFFNPISFFKCLLAIQRFQPQVVHVHNFFPLASPSVLVAAKLMQMPVVVTLHNYRLICANGVLFKDGQLCRDCVHQKFPLAGIRKRCYQNSRLKTLLLTTLTALHNVLGTWRYCIDYVILPSMSQRDFLLDSVLSLAPEQIVIKPHFTTQTEALPEPFPEVLKQTDVKSNESYFLYVGRLSPEKGVDTLLHAFQQNGWPLRIIGDGPLEDKVQNACHANPNITWMGYQSKAVITTCLKACKALIFPSLLPETFGLSVIEAFAAGKPVIAFRIGGPSETIEHGVTGLLAEPDSSDDFQQAIAQLHQNTALCQKLSANAYQRYLTCFTPEKNHNRLVEIYQNVITHRNRS